MVVVVEFTIFMSKKAQGKKEYRENTRNCDNPEIVILKMDYKYSFC